MLDKFEISKFVSETGQVGASVEQLASDSRCFVGFSGRWSKDSRNGGSVDEYLGFVPQGNPIHGFFTRGTGSSPKSLQLIGPAETDIINCTGQQRLLPVWRDLYGKWMGRATRVRLLFYWADLRAF